MKFTDFWISQLTVKSQQESYRLFESVLVNDRMKGRTYTMRTKFFFGLGYPCWGNFNFHKSRKEGIGVREAKV